MQRILHQLNSNRSSELMPNGTANAGNRYRQRSQESLDSNGVNGSGNLEGDSSSSNAGGSHMEDLWLECDDENISIITRRQFEEELNSKQSATTPYLLFYERI